MANEKAKQWQADREKQKERHPPKDNTPKESKSTTTKTHGDRPQKPPRP